MKNRKCGLPSRYPSGSLARMLPAICCLLLACAAQSIQQQPIRTQTAPPPATNPEAALAGSDESLAAAEGQVRPRVMILVKEVAKDDLLAVDSRMLQTEPTEEMVIDAFRTRGFPVVDPAAVRQDLQQDQLRRILEGDNRSAAEVGLGAGADIVVAGTVQESRGSRAAANTGEPADSVGVRLSARAVSTATGEIIASALLELEGPFSEDMARQRAADSVAAEFSIRILEAWKGRTNITEIHADNADYQRVELLKSTILKEAPGVDSVVTRALAGRAAVVEVFSETSTDELLAPINHCITAISFVVTAVSGNRIDLRFGDEPGQCLPEHE
jgi:hypothetical protein